MGNKTNLIINDTHYQGRNMWLIKAINLNRGRGIKLADNIIVIQKLIKKFYEGVYMKYDKDQQVEISIAPNKNNIFGNIGNVRRNTSVVIDRRNKREISENKLSTKNSNDNSNNILIEKIGVDFQSSFHDGRKKCLSQPKIVYIKKEDIAGDIEGEKEGDKEGDKEGYKEINEKEDGDENEDNESAEKVPILVSDEKVKDIKKEINEEVVEIKDINIEIKEENNQENNQEINQENNQENTDKENTDKEVVSTIKIAELLESPNNLPLSNKNSQSSQSLNSNQDIQSLIKIEEEQHNIIFEENQQSENQPYNNKNNITDITTTKLPEKQNNKINNNSENKNLKEAYTNKIEKKKEKFKVEISKDDKYRSSLVIIQKYIESPLTYFKRKFDVRVWVLINQDMDVFAFK